MPGFDEAWMAAAKIREDESVSPELRMLLQSLYFQIVFHPADLTALKASLVNLLEFLRVEGRTNANCWAVDLFVAQSERWERDWAEQGLPEGFHDILAMMGEALHDTVRDPAIAENFGCLPEQLLERVAGLHVESAHNEGQP